MTPTFPDPVPSTLRCSRAAASYQMIHQSLRALTCRWVTQGLFVRLGCLEDKMRWVWGCRVFCLLVWWFFFFSFGHSQCQQKFSSRFGIRAHFASTSTAPCSWQAVCSSLCSFQCSKALSPAPVFTGIILRAVEPCNKLWLVPCLNAQLKTQMPRACLEGSSPCPDTQLHPLTSISRGQVG